jgi:dephospho-CoA kinase
MVIGITGSFGSGKTTVARMFASLGARVIDADRIAHRLIRPGTGVYRRIIESFGQGVLARGGGIERRKLGRIVFANKKLLRKLNRIVHPAIISTIRKEIAKSRARIFILDAPLLIEAGLEKEVDVLIVVKSARKKQIERLLKKGICNKAQILERINSQMALSEKMRLANFVIDNNGSLENTRFQVKRICRALEKN